MNIEYFKWYDNYVFVVSVAPQTAACGVTNASFAAWVAQATNSFSFSTSAPSPSPSPASASLS